ncbi:SMI1/KNR4 family protein [Paenibacillus sp. CAU 1782]
MQTNLKWSNTVSLDEAIVGRLERKWNIRFPQAYRHILLYYDGSIPYVMNEKGEWDAGVVEIPGKLKWMFQFLSLVEIELHGEKISMIEIAYRTLSEALPPKVFPFASNGSGDKFLLDYRNNEYAPSVVFQNHEDVILESEITEEELEEKPLEEWQNETLLYVSDSFEGFLGMITRR